MAPWFWYAVVAAVLYGAHQIFTRLASDHIGEGLGGFVVEATEALTILLYLAILWLTSRWDQKFSAVGSIIPRSPGSALGPEQLRSSSCFKKAGRSPRCRRSWPGARRSWPSRAFCFSRSQLRSPVSLELFSPSRDCSSSDPSARPGVRLRRLWAIGRGTVRGSGRNPVPV
jgi:hypothetical protein